MNKLVGSLALGAVALIASAGLSQPAHAQILSKNDREMVNGVSDPVKRYQLEMAVKEKMRAFEAARGTDVTWGLNRTQRESLWHVEDPVVRRILENRYAAYNVRTKLAQMRAAAAASTSPSSRTSSSSSSQLDAINESIFRYSQRQTLNAQMELWHRPW